MTNYGYKHLVFDGPNKSGKGTIVRRTAEWMREEGMPVETIREPGGTQVGEAIREILLSDVERPNETDVLLFNAARAATVRKISRLLVKSNVIADRSYMSTLAFQIHGDNAPGDFTREICRFAIGDDYKPDAFFVLDIPYETYLRRKSDVDPQDYFEREQAHFERVRQGFLTEGRKIGAYIIDATKSEEEIEMGVRSILEEVL